MAKKTITQKALQLVCLMVLFVLNAQQAQAITITNFLDVQSSTGGQSVSGRDGTDGKDGENGKPGKDGKSVYSNSSNASVDIHTYVDGAEVFSYTKTATSSVGAKKVITDEVSNRATSSADYNLVVQGLAQAQSELKSSEPSYGRIEGILEHIRLILMSYVKLF